MSTAEQPAGPSQPRRSLRAYLQLLRLPNVFTAIADVAMGYLVSGGTVDAWPLLVALGAASTALYLAGMVLNDVCDAKLDAKERPSRPIPSGRIPLTTATRLGVALLATGIASGWIASALAGRILPGIVATALAALVVAYDFRLKPTILAPLGMGGCRLLNVVLGMSTMTGTWHAYYWLIAGGVGLYIVGVTWLARTEAERSQRGQLLAATLTLFCGMAMVACYPSSRAQVDAQQYPVPENWNLFWLALGALVGWRCVRAIADPRPLIVQMAVKNCILSLIVIDAGACLATTGALPAVLILMLLLPAVILGSWIYST